jgi:hypothetical protein
MEFRDVPGLHKFEQHARHHSDDEIVMDCYRRIREVIGPVPRAVEVLGWMSAPAMDELKVSCAAIEKSTRLLWACAAATDHIAPALWEYVPDYAASLDYFLALDDLELMAVTQQHRLLWDASRD